MATRHSRAVNATRESGSSQNHEGNSAQEPCLPALIQLLNRKEINLVVFRDRGKTEMGEVGLQPPPPQLEIATRYALWLFGFQGAPPSSPNIHPPPSFPNYCNPLFSLSRLPGPG